MHVLRERPAPCPRDDGLVLGHKRFPVLGSQIGVEERALVFLGDLQRFLERAMIEPEHDIGIHLDEAAIAVPGEAGVAGGFGKAAHGLVI